MSREGVGEDTELLSSKGLTDPAVSTWDLPRGTYTLQRGPRQSVQVPDYPSFAGGSTTPKSPDLDPLAASEKPSPASPRRSNSRIADARLGILAEKRQSSSAFSSSGASITWSRSTLPPSAMEAPLRLGYLLITRKFRFLFKLLSLPK